MDLQPSNILRALLPTIVFNSVRSTTERISSRKRQCYISGEYIKKGERYINHQFRYDGRIEQVSFKLDYFNMDDSFLREKAKEYAKSMYKEEYDDPVYHPDVMQSMCDFQAGFKSKL